MTRFFIVLSTVFFLIAYNGSANESLIKRQLVQKANVETKRNIVCLSNLFEDAAWFQGMCETQIDKCCAIDLGSSLTREITREEINTILANLNTGIMTVKIEGPEKTVIKKTYKILTKNELIQKIQQAVIAHNQKNRKWDVKDVQLLGGIEVPVDAEWHVQLPRNPNKNSTVQVYWEKNQVKNFAGVVQARLSCSQDVLVVNKNISAGDKIHSKDVVLKLVDVFETLAGGLEFADAATAVSIAQDIKSRVDLKKGDVITALSVEKENIIKTGEQVNLVLRSENLKISTKGISQAPAAVGDTVSVLVRDKQKIFRGKVNENRQVEVWL